MLVSCDPRIEMDMSQWGDHAILTNVQIFKFEINEDINIYETEVGIGDDMVGVRKTVISGDVVVDEENYIATVSLNEGESLESAAFIFYHEAVKIEPIGDSPKAGHVSDLSEKYFQYRLFSADGTTRDWTIIIE